MRKVKFNDGWSFVKGSGSALASLMGGGAEPVPVTLPHDAGISTLRSPEAEGGAGNGYFREETCHYLKTFPVDAADADKLFILEFEGVYQNAFVYVNGSFAAQHPYGYAGFYVDITKFLNFGGDNRIKVVVKNGVPSGRWYTGCGIYRDVSLMVSDRLHILPDGARVAAVDVEDGLAAIRVETDVEYRGLGVKDARLRVALTDPEGNDVASDEILVTLAEGEKKTFRQRLYVKNPVLWDDVCPNLCGYRVTLLDGEREADAETGTFGIRKLQLDPGHGLRVNGRVVNLRGGCIHHDNGVIGTAEFAHAAEARVAAMKAAGFNAIRSSHYPMSRALLNACDKLGVYVMEEFADVWTTTKVDFDYGMHMAEWWERDVESMVRKDFNHPAILMYSIGNEIPEAGNKFDVQWGKKLADKFRALDDTRYVTNSLNLLLAMMDRLPEIMAKMAGEQAAARAEGAEINSLMSDMGAMMNQLMASDFASAMVEEASGQVDIVGLNYAAARYEPDGAAHPNRVLVGSETYPGDLDVNWALVEKLPWVIGDFDWTAWDYLGEAGIGKVGYGDGQAAFYAEFPYKIAYCGDINILGDRRPVSYWREVVWGLRKAPYIAAQLPAHYGEKMKMSSWGFSDAVRSWTWRGFEGKGIVVEVYADADEVELIVNGASVGRKKVEGDKRCRVLFDTVYAPGRIEAVAYKDGVETGRDALLTAGDDTALAAAADRETIPADGSDIAWVDLRAVDGAGTLDTGCAVPVTVSIEGPGVVLGYGSADPEGAENFYDATAKPYEGRLRAAVRATGAGAITLTFTAEGMAAKSVTVRAE